MATNYRGTAQVENGCSHALLRRELLVRAVGVAVQQREDDPLAQPSLADLQRLAEHVRELLEEEHPRREELDPARVELEALRDLVDLVAGEHPHRSLEGLVLEHGPDQRPQRGGAPADRDGLVRLLELLLLEEVGDVVAQAADLRGGWRIRFEVLL